MRLSSAEITWLLQHMSPYPGNDDLFFVKATEDTFGPVSQQSDGTWLSFSSTDTTRYKSAIEACAAMCRRAGIEGYPGGNEVEAMTTPDKMPSELLDAQKFCKKLWPSADVMIDEGPGRNDVLIKIHPLKMEIRLSLPMRQQSKAFAIAWVCRGSIRVARSSYDDAHWKDAILSVARCLEELASQIKPNIAGALDE